MVRLKNQVRIAIKTAWFKGFAAFDATKHFPRLNRWTACGLTMKRSFKSSNCWLRGLACAACHSPSMMPSNNESRSVWRQRLIFPISARFRSAMSRADWALCFFSSLTRVSISSAQTHCYTKKLPTLPPASCSTCSKKPNQYLLGNPE
jgi:hypothetical protein